MKRKYMLFIHQCSGTHYEGGYFAGTYQHAGSKYPIIDNYVEDRTKRYKSEKRASEVGRKLLEACTFVTSFSIKSYEE